MQNEGGPPATPPKGTGVTLTVRVGDAPAAGAPVFLHDEAGTTTGQLQTNADGVASAPVAPKQLTVLVGTGPITYTDVEEGDTLLLDIPADPSLPPPPPIGTLSVTIQGKDGVTSGLAAMAGNCMGSGDTAGVPFDVLLYPRCVNASKTTVLAIAYGGNRGIMYQLAHDVAVPAAGQTKSIGFAGDGNWNEDTNLAVIKLTGAAKSATSELDFFYGGVRIGMGLVRGGSVTSEYGEQYPIPGRPRDTLVGVAFEHSGQTSSHSFMAKREILGTGVDTTGDFSHTFSVSDALAPVTEATTTLVGDRFQIKATMQNAKAAAIAIAQVRWPSSFEGMPEGKWTFIMNPEKGAWTSPAPPAGFPGPAPNAELSTAVGYFDSSHVQSFVDAKKLPLDPTGRYLREPHLADTSIGPGTKVGTVRYSMAGDLVP